MRRLLLFSVAAVLAFVVTPASATPSVDSFSIDLSGSNEFVDGSGSGFNDGHWYYYPNTQWYNQWFYDAPPDPTRYKEITYDILIQAVGGPAGATILVEPAWVTIALNWSTLAYPETGPDGPPPLPPLDPADEQAWIHREVIFNETGGGGPVNETVGGGPVNIDGTFIIPDYNPEWVSIDIRVYADFVWGGDLILDGKVWGDGGAFVSVSGTITHECIPAPGAIVLGSIGAGLVGWLRRRRTL